MSRTARRAAARRRLQILLCATVAIVIVTVIVLAIQLIPNNPANTIGGDVQGSTDTDTNVITIVSSDSDLSTENVTDTNSVTDSQSSDTGASEKDATTVDSPGINTNETFDFSAWNLILVNPDNYLPENFDVDLETVSLNGYDRLVDTRCADAFREMFNAAKEDGIILIIRSAYRGYDLQTQGFNSKVQEYINKGYSKEEATKIAATIVAVPGTSEHHTGLAADIVTPSYNRLNEGFAQTDAFQWLYEHCAEYGFILRYPADKTEITKIIYEPWHYRYVGKEAAQIIMSEGICYEEFVEKYGNQ